MRVAFAMPFDVTGAHGLQERVVERMRAMQTFDVEVCLFTASTAARSLNSSHELSVRSLLFSRAPLATASLPMVVSPRAFDVCYARYGLPYPGLALLAQRLPTVLEVHANDLEESRVRGAFKRRLVEARRTAVLGRAAGLVFVDPSLAEDEAFSRFTVPQVVIPNGVSVGTAWQQRGRSRDVGNPKALFLLGADEPWQGLDKLLEIARLTPEVDYLVAGDLPQVGPTPPNVRFVGQVRGAELATLLAAADVGIGNLALERIDRRTPSPLKVREYIRSGLPCVIAHDDPDFRWPDPTIFRVPYGFEVTEAVAAGISTFIYSMRGQRVSHDVAFSVSHEHKEKLRVDFLRSLVGG